MEQVRKIQSTGTAVRVISIICIVLFAIAALFLALTMVALIVTSYVLPADYQVVDVVLDFGLKLDYPLFAQMDAHPFFSDNFSATAQDSTLLLDFSSDVMPFQLTKLWALLFTPFLQIIAWIVVFSFVCRFAKALKTSHSPFTGTVIARLKAIGWSLLFAATLPSVIGGFVSTFAMSGHFKVSVSVDLSMVLFILIFLLLIYIFSYGAKLQEESDTTL